MSVEFATSYWHWFFFAQPVIPERVINANPVTWYEPDPQTIGQENYQEWREAVSNPGVVRAMLEDYSAGLSSTGGTRTTTGHRGAVVAASLRPSG